MDAIILNMFEINNSQLIQYEILEKLVAYKGTDISYMFLYVTITLK